MLIQGTILVKIISVQMKSVLIFHMKKCSDFGSLHFVEHES